MSRILKDFLSAAGVAHTSLYADNVFYSNPNRGNLLGLKQMLSHYGIKVMGIHIADSNVKELSFPCILHVKDDFVVATQCDHTHIVYIQDGQKRRVTIEAFRKIWDGYALLSDNLNPNDNPNSQPFSVSSGFPAGSSSHPQEPNYQAHRKEMLMEQAPIWAGAFILCIMLVMGSAFSSLSSAIITLFAIAGFAFSYFLAEKEVKGTSRWGDKLCNAFGDGNCHQKSTDGKLWGTLSLSEIGLGYFASQMVTLSLFPDAFMILSAISVLALLFCPWSIVVQWKMKNWCALCLFVVGVLVLQGGRSIYHLSTSTSQLSTVNYQLSTVNYQLSTILTLAFCIIVSHLIVRGEHRKMEARKWRWAFQAFRDDRAVFEAKLKSHAPRKIEERDVTRREGNVDAPHRLTVVTAANCPHCQAMKPRIKQLAQRCGDQLCIDYIVLSDMTDEANLEFIQRTGINGTPTLLVDGYDLPLGYEVEEVVEGLGLRV